MMFERHPSNPILRPSRVWWEAKGVLNPGVANLASEVTMVYRAVGSDGISRFGKAVSDNGHHFDRNPLPFHEAADGDWNARLGIEDPRITQLDSRLYITYAKVSVETAAHPKLTWETAPFRIRSWLAAVDPPDSFRELGPVLPDTTAKDLVLFSHKILGKYVGLIREYPSIQMITSADLRTWSSPSPLMEPIAGTWEGERIGAGPPPMQTPFGWLLLYHANEFLRFPGNRRMYRMGLALLRLDDPSQLLYRHPEPIFEPIEPYERDGPVGNVVFGTGLIKDDDRLHLYYGAGDGVIGLASTSLTDVYRLLPDRVRTALR